MKIKIYLQIGLLSLLMTLANGSIAQNNMSLEDAMAEALRNRSAAQIAQLDIDGAELALKEAYHVLYPRLTAGVDLKSNIVRPTTILPGALVGNPNGDDIPVQFGTTYNATGFLDLDYPILDFKRAQDFELARLSIEQQKLSQTSNEKQIRREVVAAYYAVLVNLDREKQLESELSEAELLYNDMETRVKAGLVNSIDAERLASQARQIALDLQKHQKLIELSKMRLNLAMGNDWDLQIGLSERLLELKTIENQELDEVEVEDLSQVRAADLNVEIANVEYQRLRRGLLPTVSLYGYLGVQGFGNDLNVFDNSRFPWYGISYIGLRASLPINNFFDIKVQSERQLNRIVKIALQDAEVYQQTAFELQEAYSQQQQAQLDFQKAQEQLAFAEKNLDFVRVRIDTDLARAEDLVQAMTDRSNARIACLIAQYNLLQAIWTQKILAEEY